jgi:two-component system sensor histidine kinase VicK
MKFSKKFATLKNDKLGLLMIAVTLLVIGLIGGWVYQYQVKIHQEKIRVLGNALSRAVSSADFGQLVNDSGGGSLMAKLVFAQANQDFAYGAIVDLGGKTLYTTGLVDALPVAAMPTETFAWFGEHRLRLGANDREVIEFFAPLMKDGVLAGFVRVAYFSRPSYALSSEVSNLGLMALPVFLLTTLFYVMIRRELRPIGDLSRKMVEVSQVCSLDHQLVYQGNNMADFIRRFDGFMEIVQSRVRHMESEATTAQTSTHLLSYKQEKAESVLNALPEAVLVIDDDCLPTFANAKAEHILGAKAENILGKAPREWCGNQEVLAFLMRFKNAPAAANQSSISYAPENHPDRQINVAAFPLFSPRERSALFGRLVIFRDVTDEYLARQAGVEFVSHVSHELKTPLSNLSVYSELLQNYSNLDEAERVNAINVIHAEALRMAGLINNLLNISKLDAGSLALVRKRVKIHDLLHDAYQAMLPNAEEQHVRLLIKTPPDLGSARLDKDLLRIAIDNLLSNAIKYSDPNGKVTLSAALLDDNQIEVKIADEGIGISREDCAHVFDKYYRVSSNETAKRSGHGLGLYLARQIVELHQGTIAVKSELGKGSEFTLTLRAQPMNLEEGANG